MDEAPVSWGRWPRLPHRWRSQPHARAQLEHAADECLLPYGQGRSYGDVCQNAGGTLLTTAAMDRLLAFDAASGVLDCEAGLRLAELIAFAQPRGWFPPVVPGTRYVSLGGAIANDVHGKNHHRAGSFGCHVLGFELLRSDGSRRWCSPQTNVDWFGATIGGLGLTGLVTRVRLQLVRSAGEWIDAETLPFDSIDEFLALSAASTDREYSVAWLDAQSPRGCGVFSRGNPVAEPGPAPAAGAHHVPVVPPCSLVNGFSTPLFNRLYRARHGRAQRRRVPWHAFLFPLDGLQHWNRLYGPRGFVQYQCVLPMDHAGDALQALLARIAASGQGSMLSVLKVFGERISPGWLSFPRAGVTLALDFPMRGAKTLHLLAGLDALVLAAGGAVYPAKDACMSPALFKAGYPRWAELEARRDPQFSSSLWRRLTP